MVFDYFVVSERLNMIYGAICLITGMILGTLLGLTLGGMLLVADRANRTDL